MLASSSPPNVSRVRHGPRSSATTRRPRSVSTLAAAAPEAPAPMMHTSARSGLPLYATAVPLLLVRPVTPVDLLLREVGQRRVAPRVRLGQRLGPLEANQRPADAAFVPAVDRVGVEALAGVQAQQREEGEVDLGTGLLECGLDGGRRPGVCGLRALQPLLDWARRPLQVGQDTVLLLLGEPREGGAAQVLAA